MKRLLMLSRAPLAALFCLLVFALRATAESEDAYDLSLVPVDSPGFVRLTSSLLVADLSCDSAPCVVRVEQTYGLHNTDRIKGSTVRMGLLKPQDGGTEPPQVLMRDSQGNPLSPLGTSPLHSLVWELQLAANEKKSLLLSWEQPASSDYFVRWRLDMSRLSAWNTMESVRVEFRLPEPTTDDAFLSLEPYPSGFDGATLSWEYEGVETPPRFDLLMLAPPTSQRLKALRTAEEHHELARAYLAIYGAALNEGVPFPDPYEQAVAELRAALGVAPDNVAARQELAQLYRERANTLPDLRLNYLLLAAQELATLSGQEPHNQEFATALSTTYYEAAHTANEMGDPAAALAYLKKTTQVPGTQFTVDQEAMLNLSLHWALDLARKGQITEALAQIQEVISPQTEDALLRYAPPLIAARAEISLTNLTRLVRYRLDLYPPSSVVAWERIGDIRSRLEAIPGCQVALNNVEGSSSEVALLTVAVPYETLTELIARSSDIVEALSGDGELIQAFVSAPWRTSLNAYALERGPWYDRYLYSEQVDLGELTETWETNSQYTRWRLVEMRNAAPTGERAELEHQLAMMALQEQIQAWEQLSSNSLWVYHMSFAEPSAVPAVSWLRGWGERHDLGLSQRVWHWSYVVWVLVIGSAITFVLSMAILLARKR